MSRARRAFDWAFRSRVTGRITIGQLPNVPLGAFIAAGLLDAAFHPHGRVHTTLSVVGTVALLVWAVDELVRGVNPWRRFLGAAVLALELVGLLLR